MDHNNVVLRLTHKFAEMIDGVDLHAYREGDTMALGPRDATLLVAEGWAEPIPERRHTRTGTNRTRVAGRGAADERSSRPRPKARLVPPKRS